MPVDIRARLLSDGVVFPGESVACEVIFQNNGADQEELAWATAQVRRRRAGMGRYLPARCLGEGGPGRTV